MTFQSLLATLAAAGIQLRGDGEEIVVAGNRSALNAELVSELRAHKATLRDFVREHGGAWAPRVITPEMLPLVTLSQAEIDGIVAGVEGGAGNVQDIYPLAPLQEGILFHHLLQPDGDTYLLPSLRDFERREEVDAYLAALQAVIDRHDILRTAVVWEGLPEPVQVVWRRARLAVEEVELDAAEGDDAGQALWDRFDTRRTRLDIRRAPVMRAFVARDAANSRWLLLLLRHHLIIDHTSLEVMQKEIRAHLQGREAELLAPLPFRNYVAQARLGASRAEHEAFFRTLLGGVEEPTAPFGLLDVFSDGSDIEAAAQMVDPALDARLRARVRALGVSVASVCHLAWGQVVARATGRDDVVFGTVLFGRMQGGEGADRTMGLFMNTLPVRARVGAEGAEASVRAMHRQLAELLRHEHASLALAQRCSRVEAPAPLFSSLLNYRHSGGAGQARLADLSQKAQEAGGMRRLRSEDRTNYPITFSVTDPGELLHLSAQVPRSVGAARVCALMHRALESLVEALEAAPNREIAALDVLPEMERRLVVDEWNRTEAEVPADRCIHELFEAQAARTPDDVAVVFEDASLTYRELNARANQLAHHLRGHGVGPEVRVGVLMERSLEMVVSVLAVLKAGGAYVPLDPGLPAERLAYMLDDSAVPLVLVQAALRDAVPARDGVAVLAVDALAERLAAEPAENPAGGAGPDSLAYVIYTSGSTGRPKGVMNQHRGVVNRLVWMQAQFGISADDVVLQKTPFSFDVSVWEFFWPLQQGATLVMARPDGHRDPLYLQEVIEREGVTTLHFVPSMLQPFVETVEAGRCGSLRHVVCSGEALPAALVRRFHERFAGPVVLTNLYGPTEAAVDVSCWTCAREDAAGVVPIGRPVWNTRLYVLDAALQPAPIGTPGELYIGGVQVARGYQGRATMTAERFVPDPFSTEPGARLYRTGDRARWRADGAIEYLGRLDFQVKVRGFRIELGEIEARLAEHPGVREAVVLARESADGSRQLVAWYVGAEGSEPLEAAELRAHLAARVPEYMVPPAYVRLERLPLTPNGKVDRKALPSAGGAAYATRGYEPPLGETETALAEIWTELLAVERVGRHDHFFELGGHSLLAVRLIGRMRQRGLHVDVRTLFTTPTLWEFASAVSHESTEVSVPPNVIPPGCEAITPAMLPLAELSQAEIDGIVAGVPGGAANVQDIYPLAPLQEGMLFHHLMAEGNDPYLLAQMVTFDSRERLDAFVGALQRVVDRHDVLRTAVAWEGLREPVQVVWRRAVLPVEEVELDAAGGDVAGELWARFDPRAGRLDVRQAPMWRLFVAADPARERWVLLWWFSHLVQDHQTVEDLLSEAEAHLQGRAHELPPAMPYRNYVAQARLGVSRDEHERFFRELLGDVAEPTVPFGVLDARGDGTGITEARLRVDAELSRRLRERAQALGVTAASVFHLAWAQVLARVSGRDDVVFGTVLFGRMGSGADRTMGMLINTLPVRLRVGAEGAAAGVRGTHALLADLLRHEHAPLALAQRCSAVAAPAPLFTSLLNYRHGGVGGGTARAPSAEGAPGSMAGMSALRGQERTNYPLMLAVDDGGQGFRLTAQAVAAIDPRRVCALMHRALEQLVEALETAPATALREIDVLPEAERRQVVEEWNATDAAYPRDTCIHELFEAQAARTPGAIAVRHDDEELTYAELNERANRLAHHLVRLGVGPEVRVGLCLERSLEMVVSLLAVLKAGGAYVPLDPGLPAERLAYMLDDSAVPLVLAQAALRDAVPAREGVAVLAVDALVERLAAEPAENLAVGAGPGSLAYVIYTSGSTGRPKGVMNQHRGVVNRLVWMQAQFRLGADDVVLQKTPFSFDVSVWEFFWPLQQGATLVMARPDGHRDPLYLQEVIEREGVTTLHFVPSMLQPFVETVEGGRCGSLRHVVCSGEALPAALVRRFYDRFAGPVALTNLYGPTEAAVDVSWWTCAREDAADVVPIGRPVWNTALYVLDAGLEPAPIGTPGELYIGGVQVARGYLGRAAMTAERFVPDPFSTEGGARLYRTGDRARWRMDGAIEYLGRLDFQVKVRGFRIELGEIEAVLRQHENVADCVVMARAEAGEQRLVAYVVGDDPAGAEVLRAYLGERLPAYMVPAAYVRLEALPLTPNGKVDRGALPAPEGDAYARSGYEAPVGATEQALAEIWAEVLGVERVGRWDSFFEVGGHSLLAVKVISRVRQALQVEVALNELFARPVLADFARALETATRAELPPIEPADREGRLPLSFAQQRLWFMEQMGDLGSAYHVPLRLRLQGALDRDALVRTLDGIVARHEALRTTFAQVDGVPEQRIAPAEVGLHLVEHDLAGRADADAELARLVAEEPNAPFDLERGPLIRGRLIRVAADDHVLLLTMHHIVSDGWSMGVLTEELSALYAAHVQGREASLPALPVQYADYAVWQRRWVEGEVLREQAEYWTRTLGDAPELLELPTDHPRPAQADYAGAALRVEMDEALTEGLKALGRRHATTLFMTLLAGWSAVLGRLSRQDEVVVGTGSANRGREEIERLIGFFVNTLAVRVDLSERPTVGELLARVKARALEAQHHQDIPFEQVVELVQPVRSRAHSPLFQVSFVWQNAPRGELRLPGLRVGRVPGAERTTAKFDLSLSMWESDGRLLGGVEYATSLFEQATVERYLGYLRRVLEQMAAGYAGEVDRLELLTDAERRLVLEEWSRTEAESPRDACVHELFEAQVRRTPEAVALVFEDAALTYDELNRDANRLAHHLRTVGVGPDARVAICVQRGLEMVVGMLGVLKAGGAYVPLDPAYPEDRLRFMLADSAPAVLLTQASLAGRFSGSELPAVALDADAPAWRGRPGTNPGRGALSPANLAYMIYTSGSTGRPKGVMVPHGGVCNFIHGDFPGFGVGPGDHVLQFSSFSFDACIFETFRTLTRGATLHLAASTAALTGEALGRTAARHGLTHAVLPPAVLDAMPEGETLPSLRTLVVAGDAVREPLVRRWAPGRTLVNAYGPSETTVCASLGRCRSDEPGDPSIGRPIWNARIYLLGAGGEPTPVGVAGELYIGGAGVARGYLGRPALTAERFVPDPFGGEPGARLYRTGDLGRWRPDGTIAFVGRNDFQVKVRGFRIELGEIEARLKEHPAVREAVVVARDESAGGQRIVAYVVPEWERIADADEQGGEGEDWDDEFQNTWVEVFDHQYGEFGAEADTRVDTSGWTSSYTGQALPAEEMQEWIAATVARIQSLAPQRVLEIGCGQGLLLSRVAPGCTRYVGADFSRGAVGVAARMCSRVPELRHVELLHRVADDFSGFEPGSFDTVVINSVVQYFPSLDYLLRVIEGAVRVVRPGGHVFIGDVRDLRLLSAFHAAIVTHRSPAGRSVREWKEEVEHSLAREEELVIDPAFFWSLGAEIEGIAHAETLQKRGRFLNELNEFRYDVVLRAGPGDSAGAEPEGARLDWEAEGLTVEGLRARIAGASGDTLVVRGIPNARVSRPLAQLRTARELETVEELRRETGAGGVDPEALWSLGEALGWRAEVGLSDLDDPGRMDVSFRRDAGSGVRQPFPVPTQERRRPLAAYGTDPLRRKRMAALVRALRTHVVASLPEHMAPSAYVHLEALPLTPSGKLDRKALPAPEGDAYARQGYEAPVGEIEQALATIWSEVLGVERVGRRDHFFELGGHSLVGVQVISRIQQVVGAEVELGVLFERPVLKELAEVLAVAGRAELPPIERADRGAPLPLSFAQQRLWFIEQLGSVGSTYHIPGRLRLRGELDREALVRALDRLVARHEALRTTFALRGGEPEQRIAPETRFHLVEHDLAGEGREAVERVMDEEATAPFDLERGPLIRGRLVRLAEDDNVLLLTMHHIVSDGWSLGVLFDELGRLYAAFRAGEPDPLPALPIQYADYAAWQRRWVVDRVLEAQAGYWTRTLSGAPQVLELPTDHPRPQRQDYAGASQRLTLDAELTAGLKALSRRNGTSLFMTLLAGWATVLGRLAGQHDVVVGTLTANRRRREVEGLIGFFVNTLAVRVDLSEQPTVAQVLARAKTRALEAQANQDIPFEQVVELVKPERSLSHTPLFQVVINWTDAPRGGAELPGLKLGGAPGAQQTTAKFDLMLVLSEVDGRIVGGMEYATSLFERATMERHVGYLQRVLEQMAADDAQVVDRLELLDEAERRLVVEESNRTEAGYPRDVCVHDLFRAQAARTPGAVALSWQGERWTYAQLAARANQISNTLRHRGVGPETRVGICLPRTPEVLAAMLGVLGAGGAYVPLDPAYPRERLGYMIEDASITLVITDRALADRLPDETPALLLLDVERDVIAAESADAPASGVLPGNLSHVIFTSGSTGRPKGVMIRHSSVVVLLHWLREIVTDEERRSVLFSTSINFDVSVAEIFGTLAWGGKLVIAENALELATLGEEVVYASMVPSAAAELLSSGGIPACLKTLNLAGEALPSALAQGLYALGTVEKVGNVYGPTEDTTYSTYHLVPRGADQVLIGIPMANSQAYVLDAHLQPVPIGVSGELYLAGDGLSLGYVSRPAMTAERFLPCPFGEPGGRMYRAMDRVRRHANGELEYLGRADFQVKVRGFRIEPGEIEARLAEHPGVRAPIVLVREDAPGDQRLVAYYLGDAPVAVDALQAHLADRLPGYMVPAAYVWMEAYPLTSNGKVDRRALPAPEGDAFATRHYEAPVGEVEEALAGMWAELLGVERVGRRDHFFELGGHSLLIVRLIERMRQRGLHAEVGTFFTTPVLTELAAATRRFQEMRI